MPAKPRIVRALDTPRLTAATVGVSRKMGEVLNRAGARWEPRLLAGLYAAAALEADDAHGAEHDLITQHHRISGTDLAAVIALASGGLDGRHGVPGRMHGTCPDCYAVTAVGRVRDAVEWIGAPDRPGDQA